MSVNDVVFEDIFAQGSQLQQLLQLFKVKGIRGKIFSSENRFKFLKNVSYMPALCVSRTCVSRGQMYFIAAQKLRWVLQTQT